MRIVLRPALQSFILSVVAMFFLVFYMHGSQKELSSSKEVIQPPDECQILLPNGTEKGPTIDWSVALTMENLSNQCRDCGCDESFIYTQESKRVYQWSFLKDNSSYNPFLKSVTADDVNKFTECLKISASHHEELQQKKYEGILRKGFDKMMSINQKITVWKLANYTGATQLHSVMLYHLTDVCKNLSSNLCIDNIDLSSALAYELMKKNQYDEDLVDNYSVKLSNENWIALRSESWVARKFWQWFVPAKDIVYFDPQSGLIIEAQYDKEKTNITTLQYWYKSRGVLGWIRNCYRRILCVVSVDIKQHKLKEITSINQIGESWVIKGHSTYCINVERTIPVNDDVKNKSYEPSHNKRYWKVIVWNTKPAISKIGSDRDYYRKSHKKGESVVVNDDTGVIRKIESFYSKDTMETVYQPMVDDIMQQFADEHEKKRLPLIVCKVAAFFNQMIMYLSPVDWYEYTTLSPAAKAIVDAKTVLVPANVFGCCTGFLYLAWRNKTVLSGALITVLAVLWMTRTGFRVFVGDGS